MSVLSDRWNAEYRAGRYADDPPLPFVETILAALGRYPDRRAGVGLYVGCGNGRNYLPLVDAGLHLIGLDVSFEALAQLTARRPALGGRLACGDFRDFGRDAALDSLIAIQVFQHGADADVGAYFDRAAALLRPGGLLFVRTNSAATEVYHRHTVLERNRFGGFTVRYDEGPKRDLLVHFTTQHELMARTAAHFALVAGPTEERIIRAAPKTGSWAQWEAIWQRL